jgi:transcriptional regulator with XRE-family HTH domain
LHRITIFAIIKKKGDKNMGKYQDMPLYKNIKRLRKEKGLSQTELAKLVGYSDKTMISHIENGCIDLSRSKIVDFAKALDVNPGYLMGWDVPKETEEELQRRKVPKYQCLGTFNFSKNISQTYKYYPHLYKFCP